MTFDGLSDMTAEEVRTFSEAMKKEEFRKLFAEYAEELRDPAKRAQYEQELQQLEQQRGVDMQFIKPEPGFVVKVQDSEGKKVFVNICSSELVERPEFTAGEQVGEGGRKTIGQQCQLPMSISPVHMETDKKGAECAVYDVAFHPETLARSKPSAPAFRNMVVESALENLARRHNLSLDQESVRYPRLRFKGTPARCVIRKRVNEEKEGAFDHLPRRPEFPDVPGEEKEKKKGDEKKEKKKEEGRKKPSDEPEYKILYRNNVDMGDFTMDRIGNSTPSSLCVTISVPLHATARDLDLDVYPDQLELHSPHYNLLLRLPYTVDSDNGKAKFDKEKKELKVTLDTIRKEIPREVMEAVTDIPPHSLVEDVTAPPKETFLETEETLPETEEKESEILPPSEEAPPKSVLPGGSSPELVSEKVSSEVITANEKSSQDTSTSAAEVSPPDSSPQKTLSQDVSPPKDQTPNQDVQSLEEDSPHETPTPAELPPVLREITPPETPSFEYETPEEEARETTLPPRLGVVTELSEVVLEELEKEGQEGPSETVAPTQPSLSSETPGVAKPAPLTLTSSPETDLLPPPPSPRSRFNVSPVRETRDDMLLDDVFSQTNSLSSYTDASLEDALNVGVRVYQDLATVTLLIDAVYNSTPDVKISGKKVWLKNEDTSLYLIVPHSITTFTIDMSDRNVCFVLYKQHQMMWSAVHIGHYEEEVFSYKFITEENAARIVSEFGDPWANEDEGGVETQLSKTEHGARLTYTASGRPRPDSIPIECSPDSVGDDPLLKGILKSPHSPPPISPRSRKVSFNEEVETFVLPSKRSLKGKKRKKKNSGSNSESSDDASSPSPHSLLERVNAAEAVSGGSAPTNLKLESAAQNGGGVKGKKGSSEDKENSVLNTQREAVKFLDPAGSNAHKMSLTNPHIYDLEE